MGQKVATVLTVYGIETQSCTLDVHEEHVATVLTVYGIETDVLRNVQSPSTKVATVLTVYGIETYVYRLLDVDGGCNSTYRLRY